MDSRERTWRRRVHKIVGVTMLSCGLILLVGALLARLGGAAGHVGVLAVAGVICAITALAVLLSGEVTE